MDPRTLGLPAALNPLLETDFTGVAGARPKNATGAPTAKFDRGALEKAVPDTTAPAISFLQPGVNAHVRGAVTVVAQADDTGTGVASFALSVDGQPQVVALAASVVVGFNPDNGTLLWTHEHNTNYGLAVSTPVWAPGNLLFVASAYGTGARVLQLSQSGGRTAVKELWYDSHIQLHFGTAIQRDGYVYLSSGYDGPIFMTAVELKTGRIKWRERGFAKAQLLYADGKIIIADEDGTLALCKASPEKFQVLSKASLLQSIAWTPPTLVGTRLYVRDRKTIEAFDLAR